MATLKQSTTYTRMFLMVLTSDHVSGATGLSPTVTISKAGAAFAGAGGTVTEVSSGWYKVAFTTTDTNTLGDLAVHCSAATADATDFVDQVTANILGDTLPVSVTQWNGTNVSSPATAGIPEVNVKNINNVAASSVTTINANIGTTQPINFTGTSSSALVKSDAVDFGGSAVPSNIASLAIDSNGRVKIQHDIMKNTARTAFSFLITDSTNHAPATGKTVSCTRSIDGGAFGSGTLANVTEVANGIYTVDFGAGDLNGNTIVLRATASGCDDMLYILLTAT